MLYDWIFPTQLGTIIMTLEILDSVETFGQLDLVGNLDFQKWHKPVLIPNFDGSPRKHDGSTFETRVVLSRVINLIRISRSVESWVSHESAWAFFMILVIVFLRE